MSRRIQNADFRAKPQGAARPQTPPRPPRAAEPVQLLKTHGAARFEPERPDAPSGGIQANSVAGIQALQTRLIALQNAAHRNAAASAAQRKASPGSPPPTP